MKKKVLGAVAIVGGESLIGREFRELVTEQKLPVKVSLIGVDESAITLTELAGEPVVITPLDEGTLTSSEITVLAGSRSSSARALAMLTQRSGGPAVIDMTYAAEDEPRARLRAPLVEPPDYQAPAGAAHVVAHPAAVALALFLLRLGARFPLRRAMVHIFEPASERGQLGLEELRLQSLSLLSLKPMPKAVFDAQAGFNMLARYGDDAPLPLEAVELRIEKHLASLLGSNRSPVPMPSIRLVQAPVFHGYSMSVHAEFVDKPDAGAIAAALSSPQIDVRGGDLEPPNNVGIAGEDGIAVGSITPDRNDPNGFWFWVVADNFRLMAGNALTVVKTLLHAPAEEV